MNETTTDLQVVDVRPLEAQTRGELTCQAEWAVQHRRDLKVAERRIFELASVTPEVADSCSYAVPRGRAIVGGASVRFAEIVASTWGNLRIGARILDITHDSVVAQALFTDLEINNTLSVEVPRRIIDKNGQRYGPTLIQDTSLAAMSIAYRNAVLRGIPRLYWEPIWQRVREFAKHALEDQQASGTLNQARGKMFEWFQQCGIPADAILTLLKVTNVEEIGVEELSQIRGLATAIREGSTNVDEVLAAVHSQTNSVDRTGSLVDALLMVTKSRKTDNEQPAASTASCPAD